MDSHIVVLEGEFRPAELRSVGVMLISVPERCRFGFSLAPNQNYLQWRQLGDSVIDSEKKQCRAAFQVGVTARHRDNGGMAPLGSQAVLAEAHPADAEGIISPEFAQPPPPPGVLQRSTGAMRAWWNDIAQATVTSGYAQVSWTWDRANCAQYISPSYYSAWGFAKTGRVDLRDYNVGGINTEGCQSQVGYTGSSELYNGSFPPCTAANPMFLLYDPVQAFGQSSGWLLGYATTSTSGGPCRFLLAPHTSLTRITD